jgi:histidyl-tRNA synthetase
MIKSIRGFRDILPPDSAVFAELEATARKTLGIYGYCEVRIPSVEMYELFVKSTGETTDIVEKEMYTFEDRKGRRLSLRPEGTPGLLRAYIQNQLGAQNPRQKLYYVGNMFRAERPQAGRYREFGQIGAEYIGNPSPAADAESILTLASVLRNFRLTDFNVEINTLGCPECRRKYRETLLKFLSRQKSEFCENCASRIERNPFRVLDCKIDGPKLSDSLPKLELCKECQTNFDEIKNLLEKQNQKFNVNPKLVRGLDYYNATVFEFTVQGIGSQDAVAGGGRYDALIKSMGGADTPAIGWALGIDRVVNARLAKEKATELGVDVFVVSLDGKFNEMAFSTMQKLRGQGISTDGAQFLQNIKNQMKSANRSGAKAVIIIGEDEVKKSVYTLKDLTSGEQLQVPFDQIQTAISKITKKNQ